MSTKLLAKRSNLKLKSVTIIHSATTETVRLPENNNGVIVHTAVRTKVPFKKKVRGERSKKSGTGLATGATTAAGVRSSAVTKGSGNAEPKKSNRTQALTKKKLKTNAAEEEPTKKSKKLGKHMKEIIDYSHRNNNATGGDDASNLSTTNNHSNTFGKVQRWLLESPIVAQPLSHMDHSSRVRKVMSKSQSTPERLVQKTPQKTKSMGNLSNEKVKLQVVYKPPFKFSLRLSKKPKVKTHVVGVSAGARPKRTQKAANTRSSGQAATTSKGPYTERTKRTALLLCNEAEDDNQILTVNEPNYETLKPPTRSTEHCYENVELPGASAGTEPAGASKPGSCSSGAGKIAPSSSNRASLDSAAVPASQRNSYRRSNSLSTHNPFAVAPRRNSSKTAKHESQPAGGSINLTRNFGSTQNLINLSQNMAKSKKRSSLNLKASAAKNGKDPPTAIAAASAAPQRRSSSNANLRRNSSTSNATPQAAPVPPTRNSRNSFSNIPRASLNGQSGVSATTAAPSFSRQSSSSTATTISSGMAPALPLPLPLQQSASASAMPSQRQTTQPMRRSLNNFRARSNATAAAATPPPTTATTTLDNELPSDLEVVVSDIENLVS